MRRSKILGRIGWLIIMCSPLPSFLSRHRPPRAYVLIKHDGKILLVQNWLGSGKWSFPGGGVHKGEDSKAGACREVFEEVGLSLTLGDIKFKVKGFTKYIFTGKKFVVYEATLAEKPMIKLDPELNGFQWVSMAEIKNYRLTNEVAVALGKGLTPLNLL